MNAAACLLLALAAQAPRERAVVMPVRVVESAGADVTLAAQSLERALTDALGRHAAFHVLSRAEIGAMVGKAAQAQLMGCDAESCLTELADALGAELVVSSRLDVTGGYWHAQSALFDRRTMQAIRRAAIKARSLDALLASADQLGRQLAQGSRISLDDPQLAQRLGTDARGMEALRERRKRAPDEDLVSAWTATVRARNGESGRLALAQGGLVLLGSLVLLAGGCATGVTAAYFENLFGAIHASGEQVFPWLAAVIAMVTPLPFLLGGAGIAAALIALGTVDALDVGRIPVAREGCCRDEDLVQEEEGWSVPRRVAPMLASLGALVALFTPCAFCGVRVCCLAPQTYGLVAFARGREDLSIPADDRQSLLLINATEVVIPVLVVALGVPFGVGALGAALALMATGTQRVVDDPAAPSAAPPARTTTTAPPPQVPAASP